MIRDGAGEGQRLRTVLLFYCYGRPATGARGILPSTAELWSSRLLEYELWNRIHARDLARSHADFARLLIARVSLVELDRTVLPRALQPFPMPTRTLDALHLASASYLRERGADVRVATYDERMAEAAEGIGLRLYPV